jgi:hypothetical protein
MPEQRYNATNGRECVNQDLRISSVAKVTGGEDSSHG